MVPGILSFMIFKVDNRLEDIRLYGGSQAKKQVCTLLKWYFTKYETDLIAAVNTCWKITKPLRILGDFLKKIFRRNESLPDRDILPG